MAGRHYSSVSTTPKSQRFFSSLSPLYSSLIFYIFTSSSSPSATLHPSASTIHAAQNPNVDNSFVSSLEKFLINRKSKSFSRISDDTVRGEATENDVKRLDDLILQEEKMSFYGGESLFGSPIRVYVYDMPSRFTYDLIWLFQSTYRETVYLTSNGSPVHRLIEQASCKLNI